MKNSCGLAQIAQCLHWDCSSHCMSKFLQGNVLNRRSAVRFDRCHRMPVRLNAYRGHDKEHGMKSRHTEQVLHSMNVLQQARALRDMHQAFILGDIVDAVSSRVRGAFLDAGRAMTLAYGRTGR